MFAKQLRAPSNAIERRIGRKTRAVSLKRSPVGGILSGRMLSCRLLGPGALYHVRPRIGPLPLVRLHRRYTRPFEKTAVRYHVRPLCTVRAHFLVRPVSNNFYIYIYTGAAGEIFIW